MTTINQPNEVKRDVRDSVGKGSRQPNAVSKQKMSTLLAKKRHMSGMMCPPVGVLPWISEQASKHD